MSLQIDESRIAARLNRVREHVECENRHDLPGIMQTFGNTAEYNDLPWVDRYTGRDGVQTYYTQILASLPDLQIDVQRQHVAGDTIVLEVIIRGTHLGTWRGLPATGRSVAIPLCAVYTFDQDDRLAGERIYYDRATVLRQLGVFHEPQTALGRVVTAITHPVTMLRAAVRKLRVRGY
jgi:steroid delta-isomerase-like uncharacterized protein